MISKKLYIIIITVFVVFFVVMFGMFGIDELRKEGLDLTIIMGNRSVWKYNNKKWIHLSSNSSEANLNWQKYHVYSNYPAVPAVNKNSQFHAMSLEYKNATFPPYDQTAFRICYTTPERNNS